MSLFGIPVELLQMMLCSYCTFAEVQALRRTCRTMRDRSIPDHLYLREGLRYQLTARGCSPEDTDNNVGSILELMDLGFVMSGYMLFAILHREIFARHNDIEMYRPEYVVFSDAPDGRSDLAGSLSRQVQLIEMEDSAEDAYKWAKEHSEIHLSEDYDYVARRSWIGPSTRIIQDLILRHGSSDLSSIIIEDQAPLNIELRYVAILSRNLELQFDSILPRLCENGIRLPGTSSTHLRLTTLRLKPTVIKYARSAQERCANVVDLITVSELACLKSMWCGDLLVLLDPTATYTKRACLRAPIYFPATKDAFARMGLSDKFDRCIRMRDIGCIIEGYYDNIGTGTIADPYQLAICPQCFGPIPINGPGGYDLLGTKNRILMEAHNCAHWMFLSSAASINDCSVGLRRQIAEGMRIYQ